MPGNAFNCSAPGIFFNNKMEVYMAFSRGLDRSKIDEKRDGGQKLPPIPEGEYEVGILNSTDEISKTSGKEMIKLEVQIISGEYKNRKLYQYIVDNEYADQTIYDILTACNKPIPATISSSCFRFLSGRVKVRQRMYNGEPRAEIHYWIKPTEQDKAQAKAEDTSADGIPF